MIAVKVSLNGDLRRFAIDTNTSLEAVLNKIRQLYAIPPTESIIVHYEDDEKDRITIGSDAELREAINLNASMSKSTQQTTLRLFADVKPVHHTNAQQHNETIPQRKPSAQTNISKEEPSSFINFAQAMGFNNSNFNQLFTPLFPQYLALLNNVQSPQNANNTNTNNNQPTLNQLLMNPQLFSLFGQFIGSMPREQLFAVMQQLLANPILSQTACQMLANFAVTAQQTRNQQNSTAPSQPSAAEPVQPPQPIPEIMNASFVDDVTIPDGTVVQPHQEFIKVWKLKNNGNTTWPQGAKLEYVSGGLQATHIEPLAESVAPGQTVDTKITFTAPATPGRYSSFWKMSANSGQYGANVWVDVVVPEKKVPESYPTPQFPPVIQPQPVNPALQSENSHKDDSVKYAKALTQLNEMGFQDDRLNLRLLLECNGELLRVVQELLNLEINK